MTLVKHNTVLLGYYREPEYEIVWHYFPTTDEHALELEKVDSIYSLILSETGSGELLDRLAELNNKYAVPDGFLAPSVLQANLLGYVLRVREYENAWYVLARLPEQEVVLEKFHTYSEASDLFLRLIELNMDRPEVVEGAR